MNGRRDQSAKVKDKIIGQALEIAIEMMMTKMLNVKSNTGPYKRVTTSILVMIPIQSLVLETTEFLNTKVIMPISIKMIMAQLNTLLKKIVIMIEFTTSHRASLSIPGL